MHAPDWLHPISVCRLSCLIGVSHSSQMGKLANFFWVYLIANWYVSFTFVCEGPHVCTCRDAFLRQNATNSI